MTINRVVLCINCEEVSECDLTPLLTSGEVQHNACPACGSPHLVPLARWLPALTPTI